MRSSVSAIDARIGAALKRERKAAGWSQKTLGAIIGVSAAQMGKYENGVDRLSAGALYTLCRELGVSVELIYGDNRREPDAVDRLIAAGLADLSPERRAAFLQLIQAMPGVN